MTLTMKAVVIEAPHTVKVKDVPVPTLVEDSDVLIKVKLSGSDLHPYRGHDPPPYNYVLGHEVLGKIVETGNSVEKFKVGDIVFSAFHTSCGQCFYCNQSMFARCVKAQCIGSSALQGAQAEYFRAPLADSTLFHVPSGMPEDLMVLMADILPTGYSVAHNARTMLDSGIAGVSTNTGGKNQICVVIGCGPVGLCAISSAKTMFGKVFATDVALSRLEDAKRHGAIALPLEELEKELMAVTDGRGADAVLEVVGNAPALKAACNLARPYGVVSSCGVHTRPIELDGDQLYSKNLRFQFGRCSVRAFFPAALEILHQNKDLFASFIQHKVPLAKAAEYYELFEQNKIGKTVFTMDS